MPALRMPYSKSGATYPEAELELTQVRYQHDPPYAEYEVTVYVDHAARVALTPLEIWPPVAFMPANIANVEAALVQAVYAELLKNEEFSGAQIVA